MWRLTRTLRGLANNIIDEYQEEQCVCDDKVLYWTDEKTAGKAPSASTHTAHVFLLSPIGMSSRAAV